MKLIPFPCFLHFLFGELGRTKWGSLHIHVTLHIPASSQEELHSDDCR